MERYVEQGEIHSLGLSNWYVKELTDFLPQVNITPALVQNEIHLYYQEQDVVPFIQEKGIVVQSWYPLGGRGHTAELLGDDTIGTKHIHLENPSWGARQMSAQLERRGHNAQFYHRRPLLNSVYLIYRVFQRDYAP